MPETPAGQTTPDTHRDYAGLVSRISALAIDVATLSAATIAVRLLPEVAWRQLILRDPPGWFTWTVAAMAAVLPWVYFTLCWWLTGQTLGDLLIGVAVRRRDGRDVSLIQAALRAAVGLLLAPLWLVGLVVVLWDSRRRAGHDLLFGTVVRYAARTRSP